MGGALQRRVVCEAGRKRVREKENGEWNPGTGMPTRMASEDGPGRRFALGLSDSPHLVLSHSPHLGHACEETPGIPRHCQHVSLDAVNAVGRRL